MYPLHFCLSYDGQTEFERILKQDLNKVDAQ